MFSNPTAAKNPTPTPDKTDRKPMREASNAPSIISSDVRVTGDLQSAGEVQFDGHMEGDLTCGSLTVGERAEIEGSLTADRVVVHGSVKGSIRARFVHLHSTAKLTGDLVHEDLTIDSGAYVEGRCLHVTNPLENKRGGSAPKAEATPGDADVKSDSKPEPAKITA